MPWVADPVPFSVAPLPPLPADSRGTSIDSLRGRPRFLFCGRRCHHRLRAKVVGGWWGVVGGGGGVVGGGGGLWGGFGVGWLGVGWWGVGWGVVGGVGWWGGPNPHLI